ncbi:hypothetical protein ACFVUS_31235 [Nocardia sp. NPDC058058]|uniref:hypothetical protein n=1 Tax=Nocardia sp. NPDC058058 TaxID=3346317 RepID=UPI0036DE3EF0
MTDPLACSVSMRTTGNAVPPDDGDEQAFIEFAHSYNGYVTFGEGPEGLAAAVRRVWVAWDGTGELPNDLDLLRGCLFLQVRSHRHRGDEELFNELAFVRALVGRIREVSGGRVD